MLRLFKESGRTAVIEQIKQVAAEGFEEEEKGWGKGSTVLLAWSCAAASPSALRLGGLYRYHTWLALAGRDAKGRAMASTVQEGV